MLIGSISYLNFGLTWCFIKSSGIYTFKKTHATYIVLGHHIIFTQFFFFQAHV